MIIFLLLASATLFVSCFIMRQSFWHHLGYLVGLVVLVLSIALIVFNVRDHYGMEKVESTYTENLVSDSPNEKLPMLLYKPLGDGTEKVFVYKTDDQPKEMKKTSIKQERVAIHVSSEDTTKKATLTKKIVRWEYKSDFFNFLFAIAGNDKTIYSMSYHFDVPKSWLVISTDEANKIKKYSEKNKEVMAAKGKEQVQAGMVAFLKQNPTASLEAKQAKMNELTAIAQGTSFKQMLADLSIQSFTTSK